MTNQSGSPTDEAPKPVVRRKRPKETRALYENVLQAYRHHPGVHRAAAREAKYKAEGCKRLWIKGWPSKAWARPIKDVIAEELGEARAEGIRKAQALRDAATANAEARRQAFMREVEEEAIMASGVRKTVLGAAAIVASMQQGMLAVSKVVLSSVLDEKGQPLAVPKIKPLEAMKILRDYTQAVGRLAYAEQIVIDIGRVSRGDEPTTGANKPGKMDPDQVRENLKLLRELSDELEAEKGGDLINPEQVH